MTISLMKKGLEAVDTFYVAVMDLTKEVRTKIGPYADAVTSLADTAKQQLDYNAKLLAVVQENQALLKQAVAYLETIAKKPK